MLLEEAVRTITSISTEISSAFLKYAAMPQSIWQARGWRHRLCPSNPASLHQVQVCYECCARHPVGTRCLSFSPFSSLLRPRLKGYLNLIGLAEGNRRGHNQCRVDPHEAESLARWACAWMGRVLVPVSHVLYCILRLCS